MNRSILTLCALVTFYVSGVFAQERLAGRGRFQVDFDMARFNATDSTVFVEAYYGIREHMLTYRPDSAGFGGGVAMSMRLFRDSIQVDRKDWTVPHGIADTSVLSAGKTMVGVESFSLKAGKYRFVLVTTDMNNVQRKDSLSIPLNISTYPPNQESFSDIELCSAIAPASDSGGMFYKNTLDVIPNPSMLYGPGLPFLFYYVELNQLKNPAHADDANLTTTILSGNGTEMFKQTKSKKRLYASVVEQGKVKISTWRGGTYTLRMTLGDTANHVYASAQRKFFLFRPGQVDSQAAVTKGPGSEYSTSEFTLMTMEDVDHEYEVARYIASEPERKIFGRLTELEAKRKFMFEFWKNRNTNPESGKNEVRAEYMRRVSYSDDHFEKGLRRGWKSDRGRVYIIYGPPDEIEQNPSTAESNPYEIWHYNAIQGGVIFVFVDRSGHGQYLLVHSTHRDELQNTDWYKQTATRTE